MAPSLRALGAALLLVLAAARVQAALDCAPAPGDFAPLPTVSDPDPLRARWARQQADLAAERARELESQSRVDANRIWQRVLCLDPQSEAARAGADRTRPQVVVTRPAEIASDLRDASPPRPAARAPVVPDLDAALDRAEQLLRDARFADARSELRRLRPRLAAGGGREQRVRLEVLEATTLLAFGDEPAARTSLERALRADPQLELDARSTPRKVQRAFDAVRAGREASP